MRPDLPDLPELESTQTRDLSRLPLLITVGVAILGIAVMMVYLYTKYDSFIPFGQGLLVALVPALALYVTVRLLTMPYRYGTDQDGVWLQVLFHRRVVRWETIRSAEIRSSVWTAEPSLVIGTDDGPIVISRRGMSPTCAATDTLIASIWQHLRRIGVENGIELTESMLSLWAPIPDSAPAEMEVGAEPTRGAKAVVILAIAGIAALLIFPACVLFSAPTGPGLAALMMILAQSPHLCNTVPEVLWKAHRLRVGSDGLDASLVLRKLFIPWSEVSDAYWQGMFLIVRGKEPRSVVSIEYKRDSKESRHAILSVIRHIRGSSHPQPLVLPAVLPRDSAELQKLAGASTTEGYTRQAYLNTLDEPARRRVSLCAAIVAIVTALCACAVIAALLTDVVGRLAIHLHGQGALMLIPSASVAVALPLLLCGFGVGMAVGNMIARRIAGEYIEEFRTYGRMGRTGSTDAKVMKGMTVIGLAAVLLLAPLSVDCYAKLTDRAVIVNGFWETRERAYAWDDVLSITPVYGGHRPVSYRIEFRDGRGWTLNPNGSVIVGQPGIDRAAGLIAARIGARRRSEGRRACRW